MSKFIWLYGFLVGLLIFAAGLIIGVLWTVPVLIFGEHVYAKHEGSEIPDWWWSWVKDYVLREDTLAQWIMAFFTIAVVLLVWRTLKATQEMAADTRGMAKDTRRIGDAQTRAYMMWKQALIQANNNGIICGVEWKNFGNTPAFRASFKTGMIFDRTGKSGVNEVEFPVIDREMQERAQNVPPGETVMAEGKEYVSNSQLAEIENGTTKVFLFCRCIFSDIDGIIWISADCHELIKFDPQQNLIPENIVFSAIAAHQVYEKYDPKKHTQQKSLNYPQHPTAFDA